MTVDPGGAPRWPTWRRGPAFRRRWSRSSCAEVPGASAATRDRVLSAAAELGYRPDSRARLLRSSRSRLLGVVFGVQHAFHGDLVGGLYRAAERLGYELALSAVTPQPRRASARSTGLLQDRCEALILLGPQSTDRGLGRARRPASGGGGRPCGAAAGRRRRAAPTTRRASSRPSTTSWTLGHRRIAHIDGGRAARRGRAPPRLPAGDAPPRTDRRDPAHSRGAHRGRRRRSGPSAACAASCRRAADRLQRPLRNRRADVLNEARIAVPADISVVGYDDSRLALHCLSST